MRRLQEIHAGGVALLLVLVHLCMRATTDKVMLLHKIIQQGNKGDCGYWVAPFSVRADTVETDEMQAFFLDGHVDVAAQGIRAGIQLRRGVFDTAAAPLHAIVFS